MVFSSIPFLYGFLPVLLVVCLMVPKRAKNPALLIFSLFFYYWGEPGYIWVMLASTLSGWLFGLLIERYRGTPKAKAALIGCLTVGLGALAVFKYSDFFAENFSALLPFSLPRPNLLLPIGISFYTFQILSYDIDLYRGNNGVQRNFFDFATYVTLFPQLIAGPIVRYADVARELRERHTTFASFGEGARRFVLGLGKKILIANVIGEICQSYKDSAGQSTLFVWLYLVSFSLQIYYDFSGYSDMAIGMGRMLGFRFLENFDYPYISQSVTEFWRRWHMSLGSWFRDYVYIPLGGNRVSRWKQLRNIFLVWALTGFWHGAGWNFIFWGLYFALFLTVEKFFLLKRFSLAPSPIRRLYLITVVLFSWVLFDASHMSEALDTLTRMVGAGGTPAYDAVAVYTLRSYLVPLLVAIVGTTPLPKRVWEKLSQTQTGIKALLVLEPAVVCAMLLLVTAYLVDGSFNPFIYFRF